MAQPWRVIEIDSDVCGKSNRLRVVAFFVAQNNRKMRWSGVFRMQKIRTRRGSDKECIKETSLKERGQRREEPQGRKNGERGLF